MRPTKQETDLEFWSNTIAFWVQKANEWWLMDDISNEQRCLERADVASLMLQEARGEITVYTGRAAPRRSWAPVWSV